MLFPINSLISSNRPKGRNGSDHFPIHRNFDSFGNFLSSLYSGQLLTDYKANISFPSVSSTDFSVFGD